MRKYAGLFALVALTVTGLLIFVSWILIAALQVPDVKSGIIRTDNRFFGNGLIVGGETERPIPGWSIRKPIVVFDKSSDKDLLGAVVYFVLVSIAYRDGDFVWSTNGNRLYALVFPSAVGTNKPLIWSQRVCTIANSVMNRDSGLSRRDMATVGDGNYYDVIIKVNTDITFSNISSFRDVQRFLRSAGGAGSCISRLSGGQSLVTSPIGQILGSISLPTSVVGQSGHLIDLLLHLSNRLLQRGVTAIKSLPSQAVSPAYLQPLKARENGVGNQNKQSYRRHFSFQVIKPMLLFIAGLAAALAGWFRFRFSRPWCWRDYWIGLGGIVFGFVASVWGGVLLFTRIF